MPDLFYTGPIIDAHHHLWSLAHERYRWLRKSADDVTALGDLTALRSDYLVENYLADVATWDVQASVHVEALHENAPEEIHWLDTQANMQNVAARYVAAGDLAAPAFSALLDEYAQHPRVVAVRSILSWHPESRLRFASNSRRSLDPAWRAGAAELSRRGLILELMMYPYQAAQVLALARDMPGLQIIVDHCASPVDRDPEGLARWKQALASIAQATNVVLKVSNPGVYVPDWTDAAIIDLIRTCTTAFGFERVMFGSDLPVSKLSMKPGDILRLADVAVKTASSSEQERFFYRNARRIYRI